MDNEYILRWMTEIGMGWAGLTKVYEIFCLERTAVEASEFWEKLQDWHDGAYITKRHADAHFNKDYQLSLHESIEQYRLTQKAINKLTKE